nr:MAG TPA: hypothetical protein [Caudoviricetes sp.]
MRHKKDRSGKSDFLTGLCVKNNNKRKTIKIL